MGIDAYVRCTCYEDGKATPPPVPVRVTEYDEIREVDHADHDAVWEWRRSACEHESMELVEFSLNWAWLRAFRDALERAGGRGRFPVLLANIPEWNGAFYVSPADSAAGLDELRAFADSVPLVTVDRLVAGNGARRWETRRGSPEWMRTATPGLIGLTGKGTFAVWAGADLGAPPLFESERFTQRVVEHADDGRPAAVELTDVDTGATHRLAHGIDVDGELADEWQVQKWVIDVDTAYPQVAMYRSLFEASVATGHHADLG